MRTIKRRVGSLVQKIEKNGFQILVQREILHKYSHLRVLFDKKSLFGSYPISNTTALKYRSSKPRLFLTSLVVYFEISLAKNQNIVDKFDV